jgi:hypothetical protein
MAGRIHCDNGARLKVCFRRLNCPEHNPSDSGREDVLRTNLNHAGTSDLLNREEHPKIKIVSENNPPAGCGEVEDLRIGRAGFPYGRPASELLRIPCR